MALGRIDITVGMNLPKIEFVPVGVRLQRMGEVAVGVKMPRMGEVPLGQKMSADPPAQRAPAHPTKGRRIDVTA